MEEIINIVQTSDIIQESVLKKFTPDKNQY